MTTGNTWDWVPPVMVAIPIVIAALNLALAYWIRRNAIVRGKYGPLALVGLWLALLFLTLVLWYGVASPFGVYIGMAEVDWHGIKPAPSEPSYANYITLVELSFLFRWTLGNYDLIILLAGLDALIFTVVKPSVGVTRIIASSVSSPTLQE